MNHLANAKLALAKWLTVRPEDVVRRLEEWTCGTQACFGGHLARWPEFQAMGVKPSTKSGAPIMDLPNSLDLSRDVSEALFGDSYMFSQRGYDETGSDHEVIVERLRRRIEELS